MVLGDARDDISQELPSTSGVNSESFMRLVRHKEHGWSNFSGSQQKDGDRCAENDGNNEFGDASPDLNGTENMQTQEASPRNTDGHYRFGRSKSLYNRRWCRGYPMKPMTSLESCLVAQLYREPIEMEEYVFSSPRSPSTRALRPFVVTNGNRVISITNNEGQELGLQSDACGTHSGNGFDLLDNGCTLTGIPPLPAAGSNRLAKKRKASETEGSPWKTECFKY